MINTLVLVQSTRLKHGMMIPIQVLIYQKKKKKSVISYLVDLL